MATAILAESSMNVVLASEQNQRIKNNKSYINTSEQMGVGMATKSPEQRVADPVQQLKLQQQKNAEDIAAKQKQASILIQEQVNPTLKKYGLPPMSQERQATFSKYVGEYYYIPAALAAMAFDDAKASNSFMDGAYSSKLSSERMKLKRGEIREVDYQEQKVQYKNENRERKQCAALAKQVEDLTAKELERAKQMRSDFEKIGLSIKYWGGQVGQVVEHAMSLRADAWGLAQDRQIKELQQLVDSIDPAKTVSLGSVNLMSYNLIDKDYYLMTNVENFMLYGFHTAIMGLQPTERTELIRKLNQVKFGGGIGSLLFDNVDAISRAEQGAGSPELAKKYDPQAQLSELRRIAKDGFVHSMFDPEYCNLPSMTDIVVDKDTGKVTMSPNEQGKQYGFVKLLKYGIGVALTSEKSRLNESPRAYGSFAFITRKMETEFWPRLISAVSVRANESEFIRSLNKAQVTAEMTFYTMQTIYRKSLIEVVRETGRKVNLAGGKAQMVMDENGDPIFIKDASRKLSPRKISQIYEDHLAALPEAMLVTYMSAFDGKRHVMHSYGFGDVSAENRTVSIDSLISKLSEASDVDEGFRNSVKESILTLVGKVNQQFMPFDVELKPGLSGSGIINAKVTMLPDDKKDYLLEPEFDLRVTKVGLKVPFLFGLNLPLVRVNYPKLAEGLSASYEGFKGLPEDNTFTKQIYLPRDMIAGVSGEANIETIGKNISPYRIKREFNLEAPPASPISLPVATSNEVKLGLGGLGGVVAGMDSRYGQDAVNHLTTALRYEQNLANDPQRRPDVTREMFSAIKSAYAHDPSSVGGAGVGAWIAANEKSVKERGELTSAPPAALANSTFGQEMSFTVIPDSFKHERVATMSDIDVMLKRTAKGMEFYFKTGVMSVTEYFRYATVSYDDNGNPVVTQRELPVKKKDYPLVGLGTFMPGAKLKAEFIYTTEGERIAKTMSTEDKDVVQKAFALFAKDWDGGALELTGKKTSQLFGLFEEMSASYLNGKWTITGRAELAKLPLSVPLVWLSRGKLNLPLDLNYKTAFSAEIDPEEGFTGFKQDKKFGQVLELASRGIARDINMFDFFDNDPSKPNAIGVGLTSRAIPIGRSLYDLTLGFSLSRQAGDKYLSLDENIWSHSQKSVHIGLSWGPNPKAPKREEKPRKSKIAKEEPAAPVQAVKEVRISEQQVAQSTKELLGIEKVQTLITDLAKQEGRQYTGATLTTQELNSILELLIPGGSKKILDENTITFVIPAKEISPKLMKDIAGLKQSEIFSMKVMVRRSQDGKDWILISEE
jgi:hypothetical protein